MIIATFGLSTAWVGKCITYDAGAFTLEGHGPVTAQAVLDYAAQGHLQWAYAGLQEWVQQVAAMTAAPAAPAAPQAAATQPAAAQPPAAEAAAAQPPAAEAAAAQPPAAEAAAATQPAAAETAATPSVPVQPAAAQPAAAQPAPAQPAATQPAAAQPAPPPSTPPPGASPAGAPPAAAAAPPAIGGGRGWILPVVAIVVVALVFVGGLLLTEGRVREAAGMAATVAGALLVVFVLWVAVKPAAARRLMGLGGGVLLGVGGGLAAACLVAAGVLWWMPHYEVVPPDDTRIVLDDTPDMTVEVVNHGLFPGTYSGSYAVGGVSQSTVDVRLAAGDAKEVTLRLPDDAAEPGQTTLTLGGVSIAARAVRPPEYHVAPLEVVPWMTKPDQDVTVTTSVENSGDISGTFPGVLLADGDEVSEQPVDVGPGDSQPLEYSITPGSPGTYDLQVGDAEAALVVVKPVRLRNGQVLRRTARGGRANLTIKNTCSVDAMVFLMRAGSSRPAIAVYVRKKQKVKLKGIPDGKYVVWDSKGRDWNWYQKDFLDCDEHRRWRDPLVFRTRSSTRHWTTTWSDYWYIYTQGHSQTTKRWTNWTLTVGTGGGKYTKVVSAAAFPSL